jgi:glucokinase
MMTQTNANSGSLVGIDLGGTHMQIGVVDPTGRIVAEHRATTGAADGQEAVIGRIADGVREACRRAGLDLEHLRGVGIAAPGAIDMPRGVILSAPNLGWSNTPLRDLLQRQLGRPVVVDNDVNGAVWGEHRLGAGRGRSSALGIWVGTGVGGGLVLDGRLYRGPRHTAGEIGQSVARPDAPTGARTVEDLASRTGMGRQIARLLPEHPRSILHQSGIADRGSVSTAELAEALAAGDELAELVLDQATRILGTAIANWVTVLSLDTVIFGGGVTEVLAEPFVDRIRRQMQADVFPPDLGNCDLRITELRNNAGLLGAALLAEEELEESDQATRRPSD